MSRILYKIFTALCALVFVCSCTKEQTGDPYMLFEIHGKVMDMEGNPIKGIQVSSGLADVQSSNVNGSFIFYGKSAPSSFVVLTFEDKDKDDNGGEFATRTMEIAVSQKSPGSATGNFKGTFFAGDVEVVMLNKQSDMNPDSGLIPL